MSATESSEDSDHSYNYREPTDLNTNQLISMRRRRKIDPKKYERLTADHYFLLPGYMTGFALRYKQRSIFTIFILGRPTKKFTVVFIVEDIQPIKWPSRHHDPMSTLILKDSDKDLIKALTQQHSKGKKLWGADHIRGKGEGQIFLLHGGSLTRKLLKRCSCPRKGLLALAKRTLLASRDLHLSCSWRRGMPTNLVLRMCLQVYSSALVTSYRSRYRYGRSKYGRNSWGVVPACNQMGSYHFD